MRIIIVDDDHIVCKSLQAIVEHGAKEKGLIDFEVVACGKSGKEAIDLYRQHKPDVLLMDIRMEGMNGLEACAAIMEEHPEAKILFLTTFLNDEYIVSALRLGAKGYLMKSSVESILPALEAVARGQRVYGDEIVDHLPRLLANDSRQVQNKRPADRTQGAFASLSETEWRIVQLIAEGRNNKEIAEMLHFSEGTVRNYLSTVLTKLDLRDRNN